MRYYGKAVVIVVLNMLRRSYGFIPCWSSRRQPHGTMGRTAGAIVSILDFICERSLNVASSIAHLVTGVLNKLFASFFGLVVSILSFIPLPRLTNWCPPVVPIFDFLIALAVGIILYVLILWAVVSWFDWGAEGQEGSSEELKTNLLESSANDDGPGIERGRCCCDGAKQPYEPGTSGTALPDIGIDDHAWKEEDYKSQGQKDGDESPFTNERLVIDLGPADFSSRTSHSKAGSIYSQIRQKKLHVYSEDRERGYNLAIDKQDSIDIPPVGCQSVETQVRSKSRTKDGRESKFHGNLETFTMHIVDIPPEEAFVDESEYTESDFSEHPLCQHCGADYCDDDVCPCGPGAQPNETSNANETTENSQVVKEQHGVDDLPTENVDRVNDVARWVNRVNPDYQIEDSRGEKPDDGDGGRDSSNANNNANNNSNNDRWRGRKPGTGSNSSSGTLRAVRRRISSSSSSDYMTAEEDHDCESVSSPASTTDVLAEGDGHSVSIRPWCQKRRPNALIQSTIGKRMIGEDRLNYAHIDSTSSLSEKSTTMSTNCNAKMSTTMTTIMSSLRSGMPSTPDGLALISPPPLTFDTTSSEVELTLTQQLLTARQPRAVLEGGGDCKIAELNNRHSFLEAYQAHLFKKTAYHIFGTTNLNTFYEELPA